MFVIINPDDHPHAKFIVPYKMYKNHACGRLDLS